MQAAHFPKVILDRHQPTMTPVSARVVTRRDDERDASRGSRRALPDDGERARRQRRGDALLHRVGGAAGPVGGQGRCRPGAVGDRGREDHGPALHGACRPGGGAAGKAAGHRSALPISTRSSTASTPSARRSPVAPRASAPSSARSSTSSRPSSPRSSSSTPTSTSRSSPPIVGDWTGIPVGKMVKDDVEAILDLEDRLRGRVRGQDGGARGHRARAPRRARRASSHRSSRSASSSSSAPAASARRRPRSASPSCSSAASASSSPST